MKPCDCKNLADLNRLNEDGIARNSYKLLVQPGPSVFIEIDPYVRVLIPRSVFKAFAEWYLADQEPVPTRYAHLEGT